MGQRLDHGQEVVGPVVELVHQQADMLLGALALRDVDVDAAVAHRLAAAIAHGAAAAEDPAQYAVRRPDNAVFDLVGIDSARQGIAEAVAHARRVVGMAHSTNDVVGDRFGRNRQAHEAKEGRRGPHHVGREIGIPDADAGRLLRQCEQALALLQSRGQIAWIAPRAHEERRIGSRLAHRLSRHAAAGKPCRFGAPRARDLLRRRYIPPLRWLAPWVCSPPGWAIWRSALPTRWPRSAWARSASDTMPTSRLSRFSTGRRRTCSSPMFWATWALSSSSKQYLTSSLITSLTDVLGPLPSAMARTAMSRSVMVPTSRSSSPTGSRPASIASIMRATSSIVWSGRAMQTSRVMISLTFMVSSWVAVRARTDRSPGRPGVARWAAA